MQYATLGRTGLIVSRLAFGAMTFHQGSGMAGVGKVGETEADALVGRALDAGINFFDTADAYAAGESETLLGRALKSRRHSAIVATKVGFRAGPAIGQAGLSRRHILWSVDQSLKRLGTDWIDVYIAHKEDPFTPLDETLDAFDAIQRAGKVRYLGFSNWSAWTAAAALEIQRARGLAAFAHGQMHYSLLGRDVERDVVPMMTRYGLGLTVWSPLASGFLTGKYTRDTLHDGNNRYASFDILPFDKEAGFRLVARMDAIAGGLGITVAQLAVAWLLSKTAVSSVLLGASRIGQFEETLKAADVRLGADVVAALDELTAPAPVYPNWFADGLVDADQKTALAGN